MQRSDDDKTHSRVNVFAMVDGNGTAITNGGGEYGNHEETTERKLESSEHNTDLKQRRGSNQG